MFLGYFWNILSAIIFCVFLLYPRIFKKENKQGVHLDIWTLLLFSLFSAYKIIYFYTLNITKIPFLFATGFILLFAILFLCLFLLFKAIFKNDNKSAILSLIWIFTLNIDVAYIENFYINIGIASFVSILALKFLNCEKFISTIKPFCAALLVFAAINGVYNYFLYNMQTKEHKEQYSSTKPVKIPDRDIYIFLLDAHAGSRTLKHLRADNSKFFNKLKKSGFFVFEDMESNYNKTIISISSFLNMDYVQNMPYDTASDAVNNAKLLKMAKLSGYKIYYINSWPMDLHIKEGIIDEIYTSDHSVYESIMELFLGKSLLFHLFNKNDNTKKISDVFKYINSVIKKDKKKLVFIHLLMPHPPYVFNENGNQNSGADYMDFETNGKRILNKKSYINYMKYTDTRVLDFIDEIFSKNRRPIILIMGDHGARTVEFLQNEEKYENEIKKEYKYYFNTFLAYYNPDMQHELYNNSGSLVNFYINFSNDIFGTKIKNVENKHYYLLEPITTISKLKSFEAKY